MGKAIVACAAVTLALWCAWTWHPRLDTFQVQAFGRDVDLPRAVVVLEIDEGSVHGFGNAVLVDSQRCLYLTAAHVIEDTQWVQVGFSTRDLAPVRSRVQWVNQAADLAVVQAVSPARCRGSDALPVAGHPPLSGQVIEVVAYHAMDGNFDEDGHIDLYGFVQRYRVLRGATDLCVTYGTCAVRDEIRERQTKGVLISNDEVQELFPYQIYAMNIDHAIDFGVIPGMSGSPVLDDTGSVIGITRGYITSDRSGKHAFFAAAYIARELITRAQHDIDTGQVL